MTSRPTKVYPKYMSEKLNFNSMTKLEINEAAHFSTKAAENNGTARGNTKAAENNGTAHGNTKAAGNNGTAHGNTKAAGNNGTAHGNNKAVGSNGAFHNFVPKFSKLMSSSSGRDKFAAMLQYGSLFWGAQPFLDISGVPKGPDAPWTLLEESMSSGRKVFRLFKWLKEYERGIKAIKDTSSERIKRILAVLMHAFSFGYYFIDNVIWAAQVGLINRVGQYKSKAPQTTYNELYKLTLPWEKYVELQKKHHVTSKIKQRAAARVNRWKDWKNWSSLGRLVFAIIYCWRELRKLSVAQKSISAEIQDYSDESNLNSIKQERSDQFMDLGMALCNLLILLNRLKIGQFKKIPLWGVGVLGVGAALFGITKAWPKETNAKLKAV